MIATKYELTARSSTQLYIVLRICWSPRAGGQGRQGGREEGARVGQGGCVGGRGGAGRGQGGEGDHEGVDQPPRRG